MARLIDAEQMDVEQINCYYSDHCNLDDVREWVDGQPTALELRHGRFGMQARCGCAGSQR